MFKNLLYIAILTTVVVVSWIGFEVYNSHVTSTITPDTSIIITPIPATFDQETIIAIKSRKIIPANLGAQAASVAATLPQTVTATPTPEATATASATPAIISPAVGL